MAHKLSIKAQLITTSSFMQITKRQLNCKQKGFSSHILLLSRESYSSFLLITLHDECILPSAHGRRESTLQLRESGGRNYA